MLINLQNIGKKLGVKILYENLNLTIQAGEKVGLIGRNGVGKTTLLGIMDGTDTDFTGTIERRRGLIVASTAQEHHEAADQTVLEYVLAGLPEYPAIKHVIDTYPGLMGEDMKKIGAYTDALNRFGELGYFDIEDRATRELIDFQIPPDAISKRLGALSGGQKRLVELAKVTLSDCHLALIDEPTNHMDYVAKSTFIDWLGTAQQAVVVITHDRDVLASVDRIIEIKDSEALSFVGNYDAYLKQNSHTTLNAMQQYEFDLRTLENLHGQVMEARRKKNKAAGLSAVRFRKMEDRLQRQYDALATTIQKPSLWIDAKGLEGMQNKTIEKYDRYKAKNIRISTQTSEEGNKVVVEVADLSLGYGKPLFSHLSFELHNGERLHLNGRNGVGKTTLVNAVLAAASITSLDSKIYAGAVIVEPATEIGLYEQEIGSEYLGLTLSDAIAKAFRTHNVPVSDQKVMQAMSDYLFNPSVDGRLKLRQLSGGQKARFQLIKMLCAGPQLLILDEPTNHLDLPSIEELEKALAKYTGAVLYISHDSYFVESVGGEVIEVSAIPEPRPPLHI
jgi:ATP-binding cassette subfamily F protein 3